MNGKKAELATIGGGCFWCTEAIFQEIKGVEKVISGYTGGNSTGKPTYKEVCSGITGHAEVVQLTFDAKIISYTDILMIFMTSHNPTTLNQQEADRGSQYRSVIYYQNSEQREIAKIVLKEVSLYYKNPIVTEISPLGIFYQAEECHQNYYVNNMEKGYCSAVIAPKLVKTRKIYISKLKVKN